MNTEDNWPMAREYSIWNASIASFQFWTEDLDPVTLGRATECVYTTFFYSPSSHTLCQQSDEILFGCFVIALNAAFDQQLSLTMKAMKVVQIPLTYPLLLGKLHAFTMSPAWNMPHLIWLPPHHTEHHKLHPDQCADAYPSAQQTATLRTAFQNAQNVPQMKRKTSRWYL